MSVMVEYEKEIDGCEEVLKCGEYGSFEYLLLGFFVFVSFLFFSFFFSFWGMGGVLYE